MGGYFVSAVDPLESEIELDEFLNSNQISLPIRKRGPCGRNGTRL